MVHCGRGFLLLWHLRCCAGRPVACCGYGCCCRCRKQTCLGVAVASAACEEDDDDSPLPRFRCFLAPAVVVGSVVCWGARWVIEVEHHPMCGRCCCPSSSASASGQPKYTSKTPGDDQSSGPRHVGPCAGPSNRSTNNSGGPTRMSCRPPPPSAGVVEPRALARVLLFASLHRAAHGQGRRRPGFALLTPRGGRVVACCGCRIKMIYRPFEWRDSPDSDRAST